MATMDELVAKQQELGVQAAAIKKQRHDIQMEIDALASVADVQKILDTASPEQMKAIKQVVQAASIPSGEAVGNPSA